MTRYDHIRLHSWIVARLKMTWMTFLLTMLPLPWTQGKQSAGSSSDRNPKSWKDASSLLNASYTSGESFSPAMSMEFLGRDLEDEERALRAKSDKEKAFLYKKVGRLLVAAKRPFIVAGHQDCV